jgi:hypothetical protein
MAHDIFLSYSRKDSAMKDRVKQTLEDAGLRVWTDDKLTPGTPEWFQAIERAIDLTHVLVVLLSPDAKQSEWVQKEIGYAKAVKKSIFPVLVRGEENESTPFQIFGTQYVDIRNIQRYTIELQRLTGAIGSTLGIVGLSQNALETTSTYVEVQTKEVSSKSAEQQILQVDAPTNKEPAPFQKEPIEFSYMSRIVTIDPSTPKERTVSRNSPEILRPIVNNARKNRSPRFVFFVLLLSLGVLVAWSLMAFSFDVPIGAFVLVMLVIVAFLILIINDLFK